MNSTFFRPLVVVSLPSDTTAQGPGNYKSRRIYGLTFCHYKFKLKVLKFTIPIKALNTKHIGITLKRGLPSML